MLVNVYKDSVLLCKDPNADMFYVIIQHDDTCQLS